MKISRTIWKDLDETKRSREMEVSRRDGKIFDIIPKLSFSLRVSPLFWSKSARKFMQSVRYLTVTDMRHVERQISTAKFAALSMPAPQHQNRHKTQWKTSKSHTQANGKREEAAANCVEYPDGWNSRVGGTYRQSCTSNNIYHSHGTLRGKRQKQNEQPWPKDILMPAVKHTNPRSLRRLGAKTPPYGQGTED